MKVLFVVTGFGVVECHGPMLLSSAARALRHETAFVRFSPKALARAVRRMKPDVVGFSAHTGDFDAMARANDRLKAAGAGYVSVFGGPHVTYFPGAMAGRRIDYAVVGEAETAFVELLSSLSRGKGAAGLGNVTTDGSPPRELHPLECDLDRLPFPDFDGFYRDDPFLRDFPVKMFLASRGCPFSCAYCFNHSFRALYGNRGPLVRRPSVSRLIEEISYVRARWPMECVRFADDSFALSRDAWVAEFCERYPREVGLPFFCHLQPVSVTEELVRMLKEAGMASALMAVESAGQGFRREVLNRNVPDEAMVKAFALCRKYKVPVWTSVMLGLPGRGIREDLETLAFTRGLSPALVSAPIFQPFPGLALTDYACRTGALDRSGTRQNTLYFGKSQLRFTEGEKRMQKNMSRAFPLLAAEGPGSRLPEAVLRSNALSFILGLWGSAVQGYRLQTRVVPHRATLGRAVKNAARAARYYLNLLRP